VQLVLILAVALSYSTSWSKSQDPVPSKTLDEARAKVRTQTEKTSFEKQCEGRITRNSKNAKEEAARLNEVFAFQWRYLMETYPEWATYNGYPGQNSRWTDRSFDAIAVHERETKCFLKLAQSFNRKLLQPRDQLNLDLFTRGLNQSIEGQKFQGSYLVLSQMDGVQQDIAQIFSVMPTATEADFENVIERLKTADTLIDQTIALMKVGLANKVTPPKVTLRDVPGQIAAMIVENPLESPLLNVFREMPSGIGKQKAEQLRNAAVSIYTTELRPKLKEFKSFVETEYIPRSRDSIAWKDLPDGEAWYAYKVRESTTTSLTPEQVHAIGLKEVERIKQELDSARKQTDYNGSPSEFQKYLRNDKRFFYTSASELLTGYRDIAKRVDPELIKMFGRLPRLPYGVVPVPAYAEKSQTTAYYMPGSLKAGRPGQYYANTYDLKSRPKW